jgi:copper chaperone CopZ
MKSRNIGLVSALLGSVCCVGPALLAVFGLFGLAGGFFSAYHWWFVGLGVVGMAAAWWQYAREKRKLRALATRMRNEGTTRAVLAFATAVIVVVLGFSMYPLVARQASAAAPPAVATASLKTLTLPVAGMDCAMCALPIKARLHQLAGVGQVNVDVTHGQVSVSYDPRQVKPAQLVAAINSTGYKASLPRQ